MQTFLPFPLFAETASVLDRQRLGKQRVETLQILRTLLGDSFGWQSHPAVLMWRGHERALVEYGYAICREWISRGYRDTCAEKITSLYSRHLPFGIENPPWLGDPDFHARHRAILLGKNFEWYNQFGWQESPATPDNSGRWPYIWPSQQEVRV
jgi:hypothetical protein